MDYISLDEQDLTGKTFADLTRQLVGTVAKDGDVRSLNVLTNTITHFNVVTSTQELRAAVAEKLKVPVDDHRVNVMAWLGAHHEALRVTYGISLIHKRSL